MTKVGGVIVVILSLLAGFGGGAAYSAVYPGGSTAAKSSSSSTTTAATMQSLEDCLKGVWGSDKYAAITANSALATTQDNFAALKCYQSK